jgi:hypothetical protein
VVQKHAARRQRLEDAIDQLSSHIALEAKKETSNLLDLSRTRGI